MRRDSRNQMLKARASMQGKIRDLEDKITTMSTEHADKVIFCKASLKTEFLSRKHTNLTEVN